MCIMINPMFIIQLNKISKFPFFESLIKTFNVLFCLLDYVKLKFQWSRYYIEEIWEDVPKDTTTETFMSNMTTNTVQTFSSFLEILIGLILKGSLSSLMLNCCSSSVIIVKKDIQGQYYTFMIQSSFCITEDR